MLRDTAIAKFWKNNKFYFCIYVGMYQWSISLKIPYENV